MDANATKFPWRKKWKVAIVFIMLALACYTLTADASPFDYLPWHGELLEENFVQLIDGQAVALDDVQDAQLPEVGEPLVLVTTLPEIRDDKTLLFYTKDVEVCVYIDDALVYAFEMQDRFACLETPGNTWNRIEIPATQAGATLRIVLTSNFDNRFESTLAHLYLICPDELFYAITQADGFRILMSVVLIVTTMVTYANSFIWKRTETRRYFRALANFYFVTELWLIAMYNGFDYFLHRPVFSYLLSMLLANFVAVALFEFVAVVYGARNKTIVLLEGLVWGNMALQLVLQFGFGVSMLHMLSLTYVVFVAGAGLFIWLAVRHMVEHRRKSNFALVSMSIVMFGAILEIVVLCLWPERTDLIGVASILGLVVYLIVNQLHLTLKESRVDVQKLALEENYTQLQNTTLMRQIKAHFFFNTLNTISALCKEDPREADRAITTFAQYMRSYMHLINAQENIPFEQELAIVNTTLEIEKLRFPDRFNYETDLEVTDFVLPPLCIQPIVENAMVHGLRKLSGVGVIRIETRKGTGCVQVIVKDNGVGFDTNVLEESESIGLKNLQQRVKLMSGGTLAIQSERGQGTEAILTFPL